MNYALALLLAIFSLLALAFIVLVIRMYILSERVVPAVITIPSSNNQCRPSFDSLVDVSGIPICPNPALRILGLKYDPSLDMLVGLEPIPFISACSSACKTGIDLNTNKCLDPSYQDTFNQCLQKTAPVGCSTLSKPVAHDGLNYYYINNYGQGSCFNT